MENIFLNQHNVAPGQLEGLKVIYEYYYKRNNLKKDLYEKLVGEVYPRQVDNIGAKLLVKDVVEVNINYI